MQFKRGISQKPRGHSADDTSTIFSEKTEPTPFQGPPFCSPRCDLRGAVSSR